MAVPTSQSGGGKATHGSAYAHGACHMPGLQETLQPGWGLPTLPKMQNCNRAGGPASGAAPHRPASGRSASAGTKGPHPRIPWGDAQRPEPRQGDGHAGRPQPATAASGGHSPSRTDPAAPTRQHSAAFPALLSLRTVLCGDGQIEQPIRSQH